MKRYLAVDFVCKALQGLVGSLILFKGCLHILGLKVIVGPWLAKEVLLCGNPGKLLHPMHHQMLRVHYLQQWCVLSVDKMAVSADVGCQNGGLSVDKDMHWVRLQVIRHHKRQEW